MRTIKLSFAAASAVVVLFALVGVASANQLSVSSQTARITWARAELAGSWGTAHCRFTIEGSLHTTTTTKTAGALIGYVTSASVGPCESGSATVLTATLPWHVQYGSYTGLLPTISSLIVNIIGSQWSIREPFGLTCLFTSTAAAPNTATFNLTSASVTSVNLGGSIESNCGLRGTARGTSSTNSSIMVTLI